MNWPLSTQTSKRGLEVPLGSGAAEKGLSGAETCGLLKKNHKSSHKMSAGTFILTLVSRTLVGKS